MRHAILLALPLLAGCAPAAAEPASEPRPVIRRLATTYVVDDSIRAAKVPSTRAGEIPLADGPCQTGDRMPTGRLDFGALPQMPSARPTAPLPYIPNVCPVLAQPAGQPANPVIHLRGLKRVQPDQP